MRNSLLEMVTLIFILGLSCPSFAVEKVESSPAKEERLEAGKKACEQGDAKGCYDAGFFTIRLAKQKNQLNAVTFDSAKKWYLTGCDKGLATACWELARIALIQKQRDEAKKWYLKQCQLDKRLADQGCVSVKWIDQCAKGDQRSCKLADADAFL